MPMRTVWIWPHVAHLKDDRTIIEDGSAPVLDLIVAGFTNELTNHEPKDAKGEQHTTDDAEDDAQHGGVPRIFGCDDALAAASHDRMILPLAHPKEKQTQANSKSRHKFHRSGCSRNERAGDANQYPPVPFVEIFW